jgi:hypothetical protein
LSICPVSDRRRYIEVIEAARIPGPLGKEKMSDSNFTAMTPKEIGVLLGYDAKTIRRVMRSLTDADSQPGSGGRWVVDSQDAVDAIAARLSSTHHRKLVNFAPKSEG